VGRGSALGAGLDDEVLVRARETREPVQHLHQNQEGISDPDAGENGPVASELGHSRGAWTPARRGGRGRRSWGSRARRSGGGSGGCGRRTSWSCSAAPATLREGERAPPSRDRRQGGGGVVGNTRLAEWGV
jgi:hypothetical protein